jgi:hypothetical protein
MEKLPNYYFSLIACFQKQRQMQDASLGNKNSPEVNYCPFVSRVEGGGECFWRKYHAWTTNRSRRNNAATGFELGT